MLCPTHLSLIPALPTRVFEIPPSKPFHGSGYRFLKTSLTERSFHTNRYFRARLVVSIRGAGNEKQDIKPLIRERMGLEKSARGKLWAWTERTGQRKRGPFGRPFLRIKRTPALGPPSFLPAPCAGENQSWAMGTPWSRRHTVQTTVGAPGRGHPAPCTSQTPAHALTTRAHRTSEGAGRSLGFSPSVFATTGKGPSRLKPPEARVVSSSWACIGRSLPHVSLRFPIPSSHVCLLLPPLSPPTQPYPPLFLV